MPNVQKSIMQKLTVNTAVTLLTCPAATVCSIANINIANIDATNADSIEIWITRSGVDIFKAKGVSVPIKASFVDEGPLVLQAADVLKVKAATANRLDVIVSYLEIT
jgi:hypothetical protein